MDRAGGRTHRTVRRPSDLRKGKFFFFGKLLLKTWPLTCDKGRVRGGRARQRQLSTHERVKGWLESATHHGEVFGGDEFGLLVLESWRREVERDWRRRRRGEDRG